MSDVNMKTKKLARAVSNGIFFLGLATISYFKMWWPEIMLVLAAYIVSRFWIMKKPLLLITGLVVTLGIYIGERFTTFFPELDIPPMTLVFIVLAIIVFTRCIFEKDSYGETYHMESTPPPAERDNPFEDELR